MERSGRLLLRGLESSAGHRNVGQSLAELLRRLLGGEPVQQRDERLAVRRVRREREPYDEAARQRRSGQEHARGEARERALALHRALAAARDRHAAGERDAGAVRAAALEVIAAVDGMELDYLAVLRDGTVDLAPFQAAMDAAPEETSDETPDIAPVDAAINTQQKRD